MSFAPASLQKLAAYWVGKGGVNLGVVGDSAHPVGYHIGRDRIYSPAGQGDADYSVKQPRDKAGLTNAACALDLGKLNGSLIELRAFTKWLVAECMAGRAPQIREVIWSDDGKRTIGWSALKPTVAVLTSYSTQDHTTHTHLSFWRDTVDSVTPALFAGYFAVPGRTHSLHIAAGSTVRVATVTSAGCIASWTDRLFETATSAPCEAPKVLPGCVAGSATVAKVTAGMFAGKYVRVGNGVTVTEA